MLADYFEWEQDDYREAVAGVQRGYEDMKGGRVQPMEEFFEDLRGAASPCTSLANS